MRSAEEDTCGECLGDSPESPEEWQECLGSVQKGQCARCHGWGHYAKDCPTPKGGGKGNKGESKGGIKGGSSKGAGNKGGGFAGPAKGAGKGGASGIQGSPAGKGRGRPQEFQGYCRTCAVMLQAPCNDTAGPVQ